MNIENNIFDNTGCVNINVLEDYANHNLEPNAERSVEKHLAECEMCSEIMDGLMLLNKTNKQKSIAKINSGIDNIVKQNKNNNPSIIPLHKRYYLAIAAALFFVLISVFVLKNMFNKQDKQLVENSSTTSLANADSLNNLILQASKTAKISSKNNTGNLKPDSIYKKGNALADNEKLNKDILKRITSPVNSSVRSEQTASEITYTPTEQINDEIAEKRDLNTLTTSATGNTKTGSEIENNKALNQEIAFNQAPAKAEDIEEADNKNSEGSKRAKTKAAMHNELPAAGVAAEPTLAYADNVLKKSAEKEESKTRKDNTDKNSNTNEAICKLIDNQNFKEAKILNDATLKTTLANNENQYFKLLIEIIYLGQFEKNNQLKDYFDPKFTYWQQAMLFWSYNAKDISKSRLQKDLTPLLRQKNSIYAQKAQQYLDNLKD